MIAHVAEAGEDRGRVVLRIASGRPSPIAIEAAIRIAQAFGSELESLFIEDQQLIAISAFPFVREISASGQRARPLTIADIEHDLRAAAHAAIRRIEEMAKALEVPVHCRIVRDEPLHALARACAEYGPWNVVTLADPVGAGDAPVLRQVIEEVSGTTAVVVVGPRAQRTTGSVVIALESLDRLPGMLRTAERLAPVAGGDILLMLIADSEEQLGWMDAQARLVLGEREDVRLAVAEIPRGAPSVVAETLRRLRAGFIIAEFAGLVIPEDGDLRPLTAALECPLFIMR